MTREIKSCVKCGAAFETSRTGFTVKCPACRKARRERRMAGGTRVATAGTTHRTAEHAGRTCTVRFAVGGVCGKPAVTAFVASTGETFAECAEHRA